MLVVVAVWWIRNGGLEGKLTEKDAPRPKTSETSGGGSSHSKPTRSAAFIVDVNTAAVPELIELPGVGQAIAERIVEYRKQNGPFETVDELQNVTGIGPKTLEAIRPHAKVK
ncbi:MAG: helix-hairpin-helix domain-containing protein [Pirellulales bacterium]